MINHILSSHSMPPADSGQRQVAQTLYEYGKVMVEAPPGSGKTFTGVYLGLVAHRLGWTNRVRPTLILTFSRNARVQIEQEVVRFRDKGWMSNSEVGAIKVTNYHSLYFEIIRARAGVWGCKNQLRPATVADLKARIKRSLADSEIAPDIRSKLRKTIENAGSFLFLQDDNCISLELRRCLVQEAKKGLLEGRPHYDDFAPLVLHLLNASPSLSQWLRAAYPLVVLDEFQDTDDLQWRILKQWHPERLAVFFDRYQAIYEWRHTSSDPIMHISYELPGKAKLELTALHRSRTQPDLGQFIHKLREDGLMGGRILRGCTRPWLTLKSAKMTRQPVPDRSRDVVRFGKLIDKQESTAIITRANYLARFLRNELSHKPRTRSGPYFSCSWIGGSDSPDERLRDRIHELRRVSTQRQMGRWLGAILDDLLVTPYRVGNEKVLFRKEWAKPADMVLARRRDKQLKGIREGISEWWDDLRGGDVQLLGRGLEYVLTVGRQLTVGRAYMDPDLAFYLQEFVRVAKVIPEMQSWDAVCDRLENTILAGSHFRRTTTSGLYILNAHQSKGREFDHVIIPWLSRVGEPVGGPEYRPYDLKNEEDRRLLYVVLTRASKRVTIIFPEEDPSPILFKWKLLQDE